MLMDFREFPTEQEEETMPIYSPVTQFPPFPDPFVISYNLIRGGRRWRDALGRVRDFYPAGSATQYGCDVVVLGDSTGTFGTTVETWPNLLRNALQERFNRPGVLGGAGFSPFNTNVANYGGINNDWHVDNVYTATVTVASATVGATYTNNGVTFTVITTLVAGTTLVLGGSSAPAASGTFTKASGTGDASITFASVVTTSSWDKAHNDNARPGAGLFEAKIATPSANNRIWKYFDPTATGGAAKRNGITEWEYVGLSFSGGVNAQSIFADSSTSNGAITPSNVLNLTGTGRWSEHWTALTGLNSAVGNTIQVASKSATDQMWANGVILYNGDYNEGVRLHNLSSVGANSDNFYASASAQELQANIDNWCTGANGGARNAKLFLINTMLNDRSPNLSPAMSPATYKANLQGLITQIAAQPSRPCVGLIVNVPWSSGVANAQALIDYPQYRDVCYQLAQANPDTVFVLDLWRDLTDSTHLDYAPQGLNSTGGAFFDRGWYNDGTHRSSTGQYAEARQLFSILSYAV